MVKRRSRKILILLIIMQIFLLLSLVHVYPLATTNTTLGIIERGYGPNGAYSIRTTQWLGEITIYKLYAINDTLLDHPNWVSFQLNVVLHYTYNNHDYALWVQNVFQINTLSIFGLTSNKINFESAIWNFTNLNYLNGLSGNGQIYDLNSYLFLAFHYLNFIYLSLPATVYLLVNVSTNSFGQPVISFWYNYGNGWVNYDTVTVTNVKNATNIYFLVNPFEQTPAGYPYEAELVIGGLGEGANVYIVSSNVTMELYYWNGHNFQIVPNPINSGAITAETVSNALVQLGYKNSILPSAVVVAGSNLTVQNIWTELNTSQLTLSTPGILSGYLILYDASLPYSLAMAKNQYIKVNFVGGEAILTVRPMLYRVIAYTSDGKLIDNTTIDARASSKVYYALGSQFTLTNYGIGAIPFYGNLLIYQYNNIYTGTYQVSPNPITTADKPRVESLAISPEYNLYAAIIGTIVVAAFVVVMLLKRR